MHKAAEQRKEQSHGSKRNEKQGEIRYKITIDGMGKLKELRMEIEELGKTARQTAQDLEYLGSALEKTTEQQRKG